jgi:hypothetical protein
MSPGIGQETVGFRQLPLLPGQKAPGGSAVGSIFFPLEHLFIIGTDQRIDEQGNAMPTAESTGSTDVPLPKTRDPNQIGRFDPFQDSFQITEPAETGSEGFDSPTELLQ